ncbi:hypothetical protein QOZ84_03625 [Romboutsia sedimentorum]|uniref:Iron-sulfur cluster biosynthesis family protein n=1 Tax=Romboutsia sedimentorum TaxID=1368474 RepID=A0ABT7E7F6_9FIRM|nr:hypothetical protein [Romboutsia sedimentorum]MDK2562627.1 hypothetical protein [Romboutsia sedimentorum]MDK2585889.1 hypothetical protein [Romboutsia sedimentorum]
MDILITQSAKPELEKLMQNSEHKNIRVRTRCITMHDDAKLDIELDEITENDEIYEVDGYKVVISRNLADQLYSLVISYGGLLSRDKFSVDADFGFYQY